MDIFPYHPRPHQMEFVSIISSVVKAKSHLVAESGTGTGKTICALAGALQETLPMGKKIIYLTRTNSQQQQVIYEIRKLNEKLPVFGMGVQGSQSTCPLVKHDPELASGTPEELSKLCAEKKKKTSDGKPGGCRFYDATLSADFIEIENYCHSALPTVEEFVSYCDKRSLCPYELAKDLLPKADVVTAPYAYFFVPFIRYSLLDWLNISLSDAVIVVDEAHNLPDYAREIKSMDLSARMLEMVEHEVEEYGDPEIINGVSVLDLVQIIREKLEDAVREYLIDEDGLIPPTLLEEGLLASLATTSATIATAAKALIAHGEVVREGKKQQGRLPRSYIHSLGAFLQLWMDLEDEHYVKLIIGGDNPAFQAYCLDPSLATIALMDAAASVHMSGTLAPLTEYRDSIGLPLTTHMRIFPSPFPKENRKIFFAEDVTTRYEDLLKDDEIVDRMEKYVVDVANILERNTVVFFPSYNLMDRFLADGILKRIKKKVQVERRGMAQTDLMDAVLRFKEGASEGSLLFAVMGGRISEGMDFPDKELEVAILAGIPYPKPTAKQRALLHYYEMKFGKGWDYTVKAPVSRKLLQAIGRLIRTETDVGAAVILDKRAKQFSDRFESVESENVPADLLHFFQNRGLNRPGSS